MTPFRPSLFSVDVEDWFHILGLASTPDLAEWDRLPSLVEHNFYRLLDLFSEANVRVTCFFLGWVAERFPALVGEAAARGHEIASHGYAHRLVRSFQPNDFREDARRARELLEDLIGGPVLGYRSAGFSVTKEVPWFCEELLAAGHSYDSSVFPAKHGHGGIRGAERAPYRVETANGTLVEVPITVANLGGTPMCLFGGGYLRLFPYRLIKQMADRVLDEGRPVVFYIHPREIDGTHPRLPMCRIRRFKSYVNLRTTEPKLRRLLREFRFTTFADYLRAHNLLESAKCPNGIRSSSLTTMPRDLMPSTATPTAHSMP